MKRTIILTALSALMILPGLYAQHESLEIAVMPFVDESGKKAASEAALSDLSASLSRYRFLRLVERSKLDQIVKEIQLGMTGLVNEKSALKAGKVRGVGVMIFGAVSAFGVSARAVRLETGRVIAAAAVPSTGEMAKLGDKLAYGIETHLARENVKRLRNDSPGIDLEFWLEKKNGTRLVPGKSNVMKIGESVVFKFRANRDSYLTIVDIQPGGDVVVLYPNQFTPEGKISAGTLYSIPSAADAFEITVSEPAGSDTVVAFFTEKKADWLDRSKLEGDGFWTVKGNERYMASRGLSITATGLNRAQWESAVIEIEVVK